MTKQNFEKIFRKWNEVTKIVTEKSLSNAAKEIRIKNGDENVIVVKTMEQGHLLLHNLGATIYVETGQILDAKVI